jgi:hypothetical protein
VTRRPRNPDEAPKGKAWAVVRMSHVAGPGPGGVAPFFVIQRPAYALKSEAERIASRIDKRLQPIISMIDTATEDSAP